VHPITLAARLEVPGAQSLTAAVGAIRIAPSASSSLVGQISANQQLQSTQLIDLFARSEVRVHRVSARWGEPYTGVVTRWLLSSLKGSANQSLAAVEATSQIKTMRLFQIRTVPSVEPSVAPQ
jgi:hypothetical protein